MLFRLKCARKNANLEILRPISESATTEDAINASTRSGGNIPHSYTHAHASFLSSRVF